MNEFTAEVLDEPGLMFANGEEAIDPRVGLMEYGPRTPSGKSEHQVINIGYIGSGRSLGAIEKLFKDMELAITADEDKSKRWKPPFPGLGERSPLNITFNTQKRWRQTITRGEIRDLKQIRSQKDRLEEAVEIIKINLEVLYSKETPPDVVFIAIPEAMWDACTPSHQDHARMQSETSDFHNRIKLLGMEVGVPTQLMQPKTLRGEDVQDKSEIAWNIAVGTLYKAQRGHPWKLTELEDGTCFAGISFYKERGGDQSRTRTAMAQVFLETGENFILRGDPVEGEKHGPGNNHLAEDDAERLVKKILRHYRNHKKTEPRRLVLHKRSEFREEEREGFIKGAGNIELMDFVKVRERHPVRALSSGIYPALRGTMVSAPNNEEHYLYTKGYIPALSTYPASNIPEPIVVKPDPEVSDSSPQKLCREMLAFTKLDWNTSDFCTKLPVTIGISDAVGNILAEAEAQNTSLDIHYYHYM
ncbi:argonaute/piwi family protein [Halorarius halobius]|uniref:argonaute/piwi family protein n=1 Tax=Halorarius halobius TaxID=2962671 RepID=UPI0020CF146E|nr:hypothetical protein [Halorarius halobius]